MSKNRPKLLGVCSKISQKYYFNVDILRVGVIVLGLIDPVTTLVLYFLLSFVFN